MKKILLIITLSMFTICSLKAQMYNDLDGYISVYGGKSFKKIGSYSYKSIIIGAEYTAVSTCGFFIGAGFIPKSYLNKPKNGEIASFFGMELSGGIVLGNILKIGTEYILGKSQSKKTNLYEGGFGGIIGLSLVSKDSPILIGLDLRTSMRMATISIGYKL